MPLQAPSRYIDTRLTPIAKKQTKLATKGFGSDQVWAQLTHHIERSNQQAINSLNALVSSEDFLRGLD